MTAIEALAPRFDLRWHLDVAGRPVRTLVMVSTAAHCLNDLAFRQRSEGLPIDLVAAVSNHTVLEPMADFYGVPFHHVPVTKDTKAQAEARLLALVDELDVELVVLARYMQILSRRPVPARSRARSSTSTTRSCPRSRAPAPTPRRTRAA